MSAAATPSLASVLTPYLRPASAVSVLTPSFSHFDEQRDRLVEGEAEQAHRRAEVDDLLHEGRHPDPGRLAGPEHLVEGARLVLGLDLQSPNSRVASRTLALTSVLVIRLKSSRLTARASRVSPVAPVRVLRSAITLPTVWRSSGTRFAARSYDVDQGVERLAGGARAGPDLVDARLVVGRHLGGRRAHRRGAPRR